MELPVKIIFLIGSYLVGSLSFPIIFYRLFKSGDIREKDIPGGIGAIRQMGFSIGALAALLDIIKIFIPVYLARCLGLGNLTIGLTALAGISGHNWPVFFGFSGGRGISSIIGGLLAILPKEGIIAAFFSLIILLPSLKFTWKNRAKFQLTILSKVTAVFILVTLSFYRGQPIEFIYTAIVLFSINILKNFLDQSHYQTHEGQF